MANELGKNSEYCHVSALYFTMYEYILHYMYSMRRACCVIRTQEDI